MSGDSDRGSAFDMLFDALTISLPVPLTFKGLGTVEVHPFGVNGETTEIYCHLDQDALNPEHPLWNVVKDIPRPLNQIEIIVIVRDNGSWDLRWSEAVNDDLKVTEEHADAQLV